MIEIKIGTNMERKTILAEETKTIKAVLEENEVDYASTQIHLDGVPLTATELNSTFEKVGITEKCYLLAVTKLTNN